MMMGGTLLLTGYGCFLIISRRKEPEVTVKKGVPQEKENQSKNMKDVKVKSEPIEYWPVSSIEDEGLKKEDSTVRKRRS